MDAPKISSQIPPFSKHCQECILNNPPLRAAHDAGAALGDVILDGGGDSPGGPLDIGVVGGVVGLVVEPELLHVHQGLVGPGDLLNNVFRV